MSSLSKTKQQEEKTQEEDKKKKFTNIEIRRNTVETVETEKEKKTRL